MTHSEQEEERARRTTRGHTYIHTHSTTHHSSGGHSKRESQHRSWRRRRRHPGTRNNAPVSVQAKKSLRQSAIRSFDHKRQRGDTRPFILFPHRTQIARGEEKTPASVAVDKSSPSMSSSLDHLRQFHTYTTTHRQTDRQTDSQTARPANTNPILLSNSQVSQVSIREEDNQPKNSNNPPL